MISKELKVLLCRR